MIRHIRYKNIDIYCMGYVIIKNIGDYESIYSVNPLYLIIGEVNRYIEENNGNKYLVFASTNKNKEVLEKYTELWDGIKNLIQKINGRLVEYKNDFMKIKFNSDDSLPLDKILKLYNLVVIFRSFFSRSQQILSSSFFRCMFV